MTYKELANEILNMSDEQYNSDVTIYDSETDEYYKANLFYTTEDCDVLDPNHPILSKG